MGATLFLIRVREFDPPARLLCEQLSSLGLDVLVVADERQATAQTEPFEKLSMSDESIADLGFSGLPDDWGWLCGDLCYAMAIEERPGYQKYVLIESDVFIPEGSLAHFVHTVVSHEADAIAAQLGPLERARPLSRGLAHLGLDPRWGCIFPITAVTPQLIGAMIEVRQEHLRLVPGGRLNDEAVLAGAILKNEFEHVRLEELLPDYISTKTFDTNPPHLFEVLKGNPNEHRIFHPVIPFELVKKRIQTGEKSYSRRRLRNVLASATKPMKRELLTLLRDQRSVKMKPTPDVQRLNNLVAALMPMRRLRILDVGANPLIEGNVSYKRMLDEGHAEVIGFEPNDEAFSELQRRQSEKEKYYPHALGDGSDQTLHFTRSPGFSSIFLPDMESARLLGFSKGMAVRDKATLQTKRLDELADVPQIDFLKIDVQGSETSIISNGSAKLAEAVALQTEIRFFKIYEGEPLFGELEAELIRQGFRFLRLATLKHTALSRSLYRQRMKRSTFAQAVDGDAFFVRDLTTIGEWSDEKIKRLAILADGVMDSPDLAVFALDALVDRGCFDASVIDAYIDLLPAPQLRS